MIPKAAGKAKAAGKLKKLAPKDHLAHAEAQTYAVKGVPDACLPLETE